jgi:hypothetical protein
MQLAWESLPRPWEAGMDHQPHRLEEFADASSMVPEIKALVALAVFLITH